MNLKGDDVMGEKCPVCEGALTGGPWWYCAKCDIHFCDWDLERYKKMYGP